MYIKENNYGEQGYLCLYSRENNKEDSTHMSLAVRVILVQSALSTMPL